MDASSGPIIETTRKQNGILVYLGLFVLLIVVLGTLWYLFKDNSGIRTLLNLTPTGQEDYLGSSVDLPYQENNVGVTGVFLTYSFVGTILELTDIGTSGREITLDKPDLPKLVAQPGTTRIFYLNNKTKATKLAGVKSLKVGQEVRIAARYAIKQKTWYPGSIAIYTTEKLTPASDSATTR